MLILFDIYALSQFGMLDSHVCLKVGFCSIRLAAFGHWTAVFANNHLLCPSLARRLVL